MEAASFCSAAASGQKITSLVNIYFRIRSVRFARVSGQQD
jgi:hypothetical protein